jgi:hypothetical protein
MTSTLRGKNRIGPAARGKLACCRSRLRRRRPKGGQLSLRAVARELAVLGFLNERGKPIAAKSVASMLR